MSETTRGSGPRGLGHETPPTTTRRPATVCDDSGVIGCTGECAGLAEWRVLGAPHRGHRIRGVPGVDRGGARLVRGCAVSGPVCVLHVARYVADAAPSGVSHETLALLGFARSAAAGGALQALRLLHLVEAVADGKTVASMYDRWIAEVSVQEGPGPAEAVRGMRACLGLPLTLWTLPVHAQAAFMVACHTLEEGVIEPTCGLVTDSPLRVHWNAGGRSTVRLQATWSADQPRPVYVVSVEVDANAYDAEKAQGREPLSAWHWRIAPLFDGVSR